MQKHRSGGPGGQHRNKVSTAIRLVHQPTGLTVTATESRSQQENKVRACRRLREAIALAVRIPLPAPVRWPETVQLQDGVLRINDKNPARIHVIALVLDALAANDCRANDAARALKVTPTSLRKFLKDHPTAQRQLAQMRQACKNE